MKHVIYTVSFYSHFYCPPTKSRESNIHSCVCLSVCLSTGGSHVIISHDASDHPSSRQPSVPVGGGPMLPLPMMKLDLTLQGPAVPK